VTGVAIAGALVAIIFFGSSLVFNHDDMDTDSSETTSMDNYVPLTSLVSEDTQSGDGAIAQIGDTVSVHYTGTLRETGVEFDSSFSRNQPFEFTLGENQVIQGWEQGIVGMQVGATRRLEIPANLGYGSQANGQIPANSDLIFVVELLDVTQASAEEADSAQ